MMKKGICLLLAFVLVIVLCACGNASGWNKSDQLPTEGSYKLKCDVTVAAAITLTGDLTLDLNGHTITRTVTNKEEENKHLFTVPASVSLTVLDSGDAGLVTATYSPGIKSTGPAALIWGEEGSVITIDGGTFDSSNAESTYKEHFGGTIATAGKLTVNGGTVMGYRNIASTGKNKDEVEDPKELLVDGGGTVIGGWDTSEIVINDGSFIGGGLKYNAGGGVIGCSGNLTINGGTFCLDEEVAGIGSVAPTGGLILMKKNEAGTSLLTINGGTFNGAKVTYQGGCILTYATTQINGGTFNGKQAPLGGIISARDTNLTINGGDFIGPSQLHEGSGGLVYSTGEVLTINGGNYSGGSAKKYGNNIYYKRGGGKVIVSGETYINGGLTVHGVEGEPMQLIIKDKVIVDRTNANPNPPWNIRMRYCTFHLNDNPEVLKVAEAENTDVTLTYDSVGVINGFIDGTP